MSAMAVADTMNITVSLKNLDVYLVSITNTDTNQAIQPDKLEYFKQIEQFTIYLKNELKAGTNFTVEIAYGGKINRYDGAGLFYITYRFNKEIRFVDILLLA